MRVLCCACAVVGCGSDGLDERNGCMTERKTGGTHLQINTHPKRKCPHGQTLDLQSESSSTIGTETCSDPVADGSMKSVSNGLVRPRQEANKAVT